MRNDAMGFFWADLPAAARVKKEPIKRTPPEPTWLRPDYLPGLEEARSATFDIMDEAEVIRVWMTQEKVFFDVECYKNYFLASFVSESGKVLYFEMDEAYRLLDIGKFKWCLEHFLTVGFNSLSYDLTMSFLACDGLDTYALKEASDQIIVQQMPPWIVLKKHQVKRLKVDHIDLIEVAPLQANLKIYGGRLHSKRMQDLPFHPSTTLSEDQKLCVRLYNIRADLATTALLYKSLEKEVDLRVELSNQHRIDLRSKSDAQIAEAVIAKEYERRTGQTPGRTVVEPGTVYKYQTPGFIKFRSPELQKMLRVIQNANLIVEDSGAIALPLEIKKLKIPLGKSVYKMGIGGLHSTEKSTFHVSDTEYQLYDKDVTSYYPSIILNLGLYPVHLGPVFLDIYRGIVQTRIQAKRDGDKVVAATLKIVINGSFGKLGSKYSILYSPDLMLQVTLSGQLSLLMLIEALEDAGIRVVSANTDGIVIKCKNSMKDLMDTIVAQWEAATGFNTEENRYLALFSKDVNNYIAVKQKKAGETWLLQPAGVKCKGAYANPWANKDDVMRLHKNPTNTICVEAVQNFLTRGTPLDHTIRNSRDITKFVSVRTVKGGGVKVWGRGQPPEHNTKEELLEMAGYYKFSSDAYTVVDEDYKAVLTVDAAYERAVEKLSPLAETEYLGKSVRWYYAKNVPGEIVYASSGNRVPKCIGAKPALDLPTEFPNDLDYDWYINEAKSILGDLSVAVEM